MIGGAIGYKCIVLLVMNLFLFIITMKSLVHAPNSKIVDDYSVLESEDFNNIATNEKLEDYLSGRNQR